MTDPLAKLVNDEDGAYGVTPTRSLLKRMYEVSSPEFFLEATEQMLERIVLIEMFLEEEQGYKISKEELEEFRSKRMPDIKKEIGRMVQLLYGSVARREGG